MKSRIKKLIGLSLVLCLVICITFVSVPKGEIYYGDYIGYTRTSGGYYDSSLYASLYSLYGMYNDLYYGFYGGLYGIYGGLMGMYGIYNPFSINLYYPIKTVGGMIYQVPFVHVDLVELWTGPKQYNTCHFPWQLCNFTKVGGYTYTMWDLWRNLYHPFSQITKPTPTFWIGPRVFAGKDPNTGIKYVRDDYSLLWTTPSIWSGIRDVATGFSIYIESLSVHYENEIDLNALANVLDSGHLKVNIEVGGLRVPKNPNNDHFVAEPGLGTNYADTEWKKIKRWLDAGGSLDTVTLDNSFTWTIHVLFNTNNQDLVDPNSILCYEEIIEEQVNYMEKLKEHLPNIRFSVTEFAGFFDVTNINGTLLYPADATDAPENRYQEAYAEHCSDVLDLSFQHWFELFIQKVRDRGLDVDWFVIDYPLWRVERDGSRMGRTYDYGRILAIENIVRGQGVRIAIFLNAYHEDHTEGIVCYKDASWPDPDCVFDPVKMELADQQAAERTIQFLQGYLAAGGRAEKYVHQSWHPHPHLTGPETQEDTFLYISTQLSDLLFESDLSSYIPSIDILYINLLNFNFLNFNIFNYTQRPIIFL